MKRFCLFLQVFVLVFFLVQPVWAAKEGNVFVRIEGYDKTIAKGYTESYTFLDAVQKLCADENINIISKQGKNKSIHEINGLQENAIANGGWYGFIIRQDKVVQPVDIWDAALQKGDEVVVYYGENDTKKTATLSPEIAGNSLKLTVIASYTKWVSSAGIWMPQLVDERISGIKIHLKTPDGTEQIAVTNSSGMASFAVIKPGRYTFYGEGYRYLNTPTMVKTDEMDYYHQIEDGNAITRAEFAALMTSGIKLEQKGSVAKFHDLPSGHHHYASVSVAVSNQAMSGYADGTFRPDQPMKVYEAVSAAAKLLGDTGGDASVSFEGTPNWARGHMQFASQNGLLSGIGQNYGDVMQYETANQLILNVMDWLG